MKSLFPSSVTLRPSGINFGLRNKTVSVSLGNRSRKTLSSNQLHLCQWNNKNQNIYLLEKSCLIPTLIKQIELRVSLSNISPTLCLFRCLSSLVWISERVYVCTPPWAFSSVYPCARPCPCSTFLYRGLCGVWACVFLPLLSLVYGNLVRFILFVTAFTNSTSTRLSAKFPRL